MRQIIHEQITLESTNCCMCGVVFAMPTDMLTKRRASGADLYCPNGHALVFRETTEQKLRKELEQAKREASAARLREQVEFDQRLAAEADRDKALRANQRMNKRITAGVCPCCNRTFENLQRHMHTKHPHLLKR